MRFLLFGLLVAALVGWLVTYQRQRWRIRQLERSKEEIQVEENLVFDFLHGLGEAFATLSGPHDLHRLIVEGATRILDAHGGALYMVDRTGTKLMPAFISKGCPPLIEVPAADSATGRFDAGRARKLSALASNQCRRRPGRPRLANRAAGLV